MKTVILFLMTTVSIWGKPALTEYGVNVYSQFGEDGIVKKIFEIIGTSSKVAVEFGAADGFTLSNTAQLWTNDPSWKAYLIESDAQSFKNMEKNVLGYSCVPIHSKVGIGPSDSLEIILAGYNLPSSIDLLSIDIDGDDYYIFKSLNFLHPRVIICEYNPTIPAHLDVYGEYGNIMGCSVGALRRVAKEKGYSLVAITVSNCIFVRDEDFVLFEDYETELEKISMDRCLRYIITDYAGNYQILGQSDFADPYGMKRPMKARVRGNIEPLPAIQLTQD